MHILYWHIFGFLELNTINTSLFFLFFGRGGMKSSELVNGTGPYITPCLIDTPELEPVQKTKSSGIACSAHYVFCYVSVFPLFPCRNSLPPLLSVLWGQAEGELCARQCRTGETATGSGGAAEERKGEEGEGGEGGEGEEGKGGQGAGEPEEAGGGEAVGETERDGETMRGGKAQGSWEERGEWEKLWDALCLDYGDR